MPEEKCESGEQRPIRMPGLRDGGSLRSSGVVLVLVVGVPLGALVGLLALGVFAAMAAIVIAAVDDPSDAATIVGDNLLIPDFGPRKRR